ncbi:hypothetical protein NQ314_003312 [Rhamnusium bicolor]|uniref:Uncharacterized protein n=1 Tax=Rhamnusium bicolor TaxID=1586634 RepID=A0AAV8ZNY9_9CUCU|nr:hypothetical protein NQ314_003312 [Rhamnusium bicolor]
MISVFADVPTCLESWAKSKKLPFIQQEVLNPNNCCSPTPLKEMFHLISLSTLTKALAAKLKLKAMKRLRRNLAQKKKKFFL